MAHNLYSGFAIQNTFMSTVVLINGVSEVLQRHYLLSAILLTSLFDFCTTADFDIKYFVNENTAGVLGNRYILVPTMCLHIGRDRFWISVCQTVPTLSSSCMFLSVRTVTIF